MRTLLPVALLAGGCTTNLPFYIPCDLTPQELAPDEVSGLGFSADDAVAWFGDTATVEVTWTGRHSRTPPEDIIDVAAGPIVGAITYTPAIPDGPDTDPAACAPYEHLAFEREASFATRDGAVTGTGILRFTLQGLDLHEAEIVGQATDVALSEARWAEVDAAVGSDLAPPEQIVLDVAHAPSGDTAAISADGPDYVLSVWKCNEHVKGECASWE